MGEFLVFALLAVLAGAVPALLRRRRRARLARGDAAGFSVRLAGEHAPYPSAPRRGVLRVGPDELTWTARHGGLSLDLAPAGVRPISARGGRRGEGAGPDGVVLTAADGTGTPLRLVAGVDTLEHLDEVLRARGLPDAPEPPRVLSGASTRPALGMPALVVTVGLLALAVVGAALTQGVRVTGTLTSGPDRDSMCDVRWTDPRDGLVKTNGYECYDGEGPGDEVDLLALPAPLEDEVVWIEDAWFWLAVGGAVTLGGVGWAAWRVRAARRDQARDDASRPGGPAPVLPAELTAAQLSYEQVSAAQRMRAQADGWSFDADAEPPATATSPRRALLLGLSLALLPLVGGAFGALLAGWTSVAGVWAATGPTAQVTATVAEDAYYEEIVPFGPGDLEVRFPLRDGGFETTLVSVRGLPEDLPETLPVAYSLDDPDRAYALAYDGRPVGAGLGGAALLVGLAWSGWRARQVLAVHRAEARARTGARRWLRYVLAPDVDGSCQLLLWEPGALRPAHVLVLADDLLGRLPGAGEVELRGPFSPGEVVVPYVGGRELATASPLLEIEVEDLLGLLNQTVPTDA